MSNFEVQIYEIKSMATTPAATFEGIRAQLRGGSASPVYVIHGAEGYYIDVLIRDFEALVPEDERDFNLTVIYAPDATPDMVVDACRRYPLMADRQVVILKEAQSVGALFMDKLAAYVAKPSSQTVFVVAARGDLVKGAKFIKAAQASKALFFESKKLRDNQVGPMIQQFVSAAGLSIDAKALAMLVEHTGPDLSRIHNEVEKVTVALPKGAAVTPSVIEKLIGVSKDFNNFELVDAVARRDVATAYRISEYFRSNPKQNPAIMTGVALFGYFSKLLLCRYSPDLSDRGLMQASGARFPGQLANYKEGLRNYTARQIIGAISAIRRFDVRCKGVGSRANEYDLLHDMLFAIFH